MRAFILKNERSERAAVYPTPVYTARNPLVGHSSGTYQQLSVRPMYRGSNGLKRYHFCDIEHAGSPQFTVEVPLSIEQGGEVPKRREMLVDDFRSRLLKGHLGKFPAAVVAFPLRGGHTLYFGASS